MTAPLSEHSSQEPLGELLAVLSHKWLLLLNVQTKTAKAKLKVMTGLVRMHSLSALPSTLFNMLLYEVVTLIPKKEYLRQILPINKSGKSISESTKVALLPSVNSSCSYSQGFG